MLNIRYRERTNAWPGFVDLFSNLVIILIFLLIVFVFLWTTTSVFNKNVGAKKIADLETANQAQAEQIEQMNADKESQDQMLAAARAALERQESEMQKIDDIANAYEEKIAELTASQQELVNQIAELTALLQTAQDEKENLINREEENTAMILDNATSEINELNARIAELEEQLKHAEELARQQDIDYIEMSNRLNKALADKVAELNAMAQYQSEFYKQIKNALGDRTAIRQSGDRFIVSSDILFKSGSYTLSADGKKQLALLAGIIKDFENKIPSDIDWIIRVDGHTDTKAVLDGTRGYKNNMELSLLRATAVVNELVRDGVSKRRLVPSGFGEMRPVELGKDPASLQKNRRIELQLTNK